MLNKFFKSNEIIYSSNLSLSWLSKGYFGSSKMLKLKSKTGNKLFLGVSKTEEIKVKFIDFYYLDKKNIFNNVFDKISILEKFLNDFLIGNNFEFGIEINLYSTQNIGNGFGIIGTFCSLLSTFLSDKLGKNKDYCINLAGKLEKILKHNSSSVDSHLSFLSDGGMLLVIPGKKINVNVLGELSDYTDYFVIDSGYSVNQDLSEKIIDNDIKHIEKLNIEFTSNYLEENNFSDILLTGDSIKKSFFSIFHLINIKIINSFNKLKNDVYDEKNIEDLFKNLNLQKNILFLLSKQTQFYTDLKKNFEGLKTNKQEKIAIVPHYSGKTGGSFLLCCKSVISRNTILKLETKMQEYYENSKIVYKSYEDLGKIEGIVKQQDIGKKIYGTNFKKSYILETSKKTIIVEDLKETFNLGFDIIFDHINNDIYISGNKLTSKDIHSRTTAIVLFDLLLKKLVISNKDLPRSSYSLSKSEMGGKIIYPIRNLIEKYLNKKIYLEIIGKSSDFNIELKIGEFKIGILKQI